MISSRVIIINPILSLRCLDTRVPSLVEGYKAFVKINLDPSRNKSFNVIDLKDDDHLPYPLRYLFSIYLSSMNIANKSRMGSNARQTFRRKFALNSSSGGREACVSLEANIFRRVHATIREDLSGRSLSIDRVRDYL